jgi:hypothetical protein
LGLPRRTEIPAKEEAAEAMEPTIPVAVAAAHAVAAAALAEGLALAVDPALLCSLTSPG